MPKDPFLFWHELKRRRVVRIIPVYLAAGFVLLELIDIIAEPFGLPGWTLKLVIILLAIGLIVSIMLAWIYDVTPEGVRKTEPLKNGYEPVKEAPAKIKGWKIATYTSMVIIIGLIVLNILGTRKRAKFTQEKQRSVAVLPFESLSGDESQAWFTDGITDVIINHLSKISDLRVLSRTSTLKYKEEKKRIPEIGEELGVNYILEGTVQREGDQIRISVQLVRAVNEGHLWSGLYDREYTGLFAIQSEIALNVASELKSIITPQEKHLINKVPTSDMEAFDYHLQARDQYFQFLLTHNRDHLDTVVDLSRKSLSLDPEFALAYYWLGNSSSSDIWLSTYYKPFYNDSALYYFNRALELDSTLVDAYLGRGTYFYENAMTEQALADIKKAIRFDPNYARAYITLGMIYYDARDYVNALANYRRAEVLERGEQDLVLIHYAIWWIYVSVGNLDHAYSYSLETMLPEQAYSINWWLLALRGDWNALLVFAEEGLEQEPDNGGLYQLKAMALSALERNTEAEVAIRMAMNYAPLTMNSYAITGSILWANGHKDEAMDYFDKQIVFCKSSIEEKNQYGITAAAYDLAGIYAFLGNRDASVKWLREYEKLGFTIGNHLYIKVDPLFKSLWNDAAFLEIVKRVNEKMTLISTRITEMEDQGLL